MQSCKCTDVADNGIQRVCCRSARSERGDMKTAQQMVDEAAKRDIVPRAGASPAPATVKETYAIIFKNFAATS